MIATSPAWRDFEPRTFFLLVFPGLAASALFIPVLTLGPIAFAIRDDFELSTAEIGFAYTAYFLTSSVLTGVGGRIIQYASTLTIVRMGLALSAVTAIVMAFSTSALAFIVVSIIAGAVNGLTTPSINVLITRLVPLRRRGLAFGLKAAAVPATSAVAACAAWAAFTFNTPWQALYWVMAGIGAVVMLSTILLGTGDRAIARNPPTADGRGNSSSHLSLGFLAVGGLFGAAGTAVLPPFLIDGLIAHGLSPSTSASLLALGSGLGIASRVLVGGLSDRWPRPLGHLLIVALMMVVASLSMFGLALGQNDPTLVVATVCSFTIGWAWPGLIHYAVIALHPESPALATSFMQSGTFMGSVIGPLGFGLLAERVSFTAAWSVCAISVVFAAAFLLAGVHTSRTVASAQPSASS